VEQLARQISTDYAGRRPVLVGVLKGAWVFLADLARRLSVPVQVDFVMLSTYGMRTHTSGEPVLKLDVSLDLAGRDVLVVEDVVDTGTCIPWLLEHLRGKRAASLRLCALLDKPAHRRRPVTIDYLGFTVPDVFVVGYGIDCREDCRELPFVGAVETCPPEGDVR
jgi:hypoxanthine phosphoribosyltransferase